MGTYFEVEEETTKKVDERTRWRIVCDVHGTEMGERA